jgi:nucleoside-diphosphate-sugar epimerase
MKLSGRRALGTGAASGIGAAIAARLKADGAEVLRADRAPGCDLMVDVRHRILRSGWWLTGAALVVDGGATAHP